MQLVEVEMIMCSEVTGDVGVFAGMPLEVLTSTTGKLTGDPDTFIGMDSLKRLHVPSLGLKRIVR